jgi:cbb3-type cytochrome oxidase subunit 3
MATSTGKTIALILLVALILLWALRFSPLFIAPFGAFTGVMQALTSTKSGINTIHVWPFKFHWSMISLFSLLMLALWIVVIVWVYRDAERRGMNGILWALLVFIGNLIGLIIYLIVRSDRAEIAEEDPGKKTAQPCPNCQKPVDTGFAFCPHCATKLQAGGCPKCGEPVEESWKLCPHCGQKLKSE